MVRHSFSYDGILYLFDIDFHTKVANCPDNTCSQVSKLAWLQSPDVSQRSSSVLQFIFKLVLKT